MSHPFNTFALKLKVHCKDCGKKLEKQLLKFKGVRSVKIDQKLGKVVISGEVDPAKILSKFEKCGREAELWPCEQLKVNDPLNDSDIMAQLDQLSDIRGLHTVEVTKTTKLTFQGQSTSNNPRITQSKVLPHGGGDGGGRLCSASSSCCGCHHGNTSFGSCCANNRNNYSYHNVPMTQSEVLPHGGGGGDGFCSASSSCCGGHGGNYTSSGSCCANYRNNYSYHCPRPPPMENRYIPDPYVIPPPWSGDRPSPSAPLMPHDYIHQAPPSPPAPSCASFLLQCLK
ncbi:hypothetical protein RND71_025906 [Anisodus tanguticus]|uniref:HMA domain-containing protein n=1 Tax=Anisodus tanguticus TaxID=243964 RepID=A0AAE1RMH3_9SOLA|nr:hypothetical protein RND71_025906 [Anisodus tanguticus]